MFVSEYSQVFKAETTSKPVRIFRVVLLFSYQRTLSFSERLCRPHQRQLVYIIINRFICQELFLFFFQTFFQAAVPLFIFQASLWCCFQALNCCNARICISVTEALVWNHILYSQLCCPLARTFCIITCPLWIVNSFLSNFFFFQKNVYNLSDSAIKSGISLVLRLGYVPTLIKLCKGQN